MKQPKAIACTQLDKRAVRRSRGKHRRLTLQERVQADLPPVPRAHHRVRHQAADPKRTARAPQKPRPQLTLRLQGATLQRRRSGGDDRLADARTPNRDRERHPAEQRGAILPASHRPPDAYSLFHHRAGVRAPFGFIGCEQVLIGPPRQYVGELPREIVSVAQSRAQSLADERRSQMRRVAEQKHPPKLEARGQPGAKCITRIADNLQSVQVAACGPWLQEPSQCFRTDQVSLVLTVVAQLELPTVAVTSDLHEGGGASRVADLLDTIPRLQRPPGTDVDHEPPFGEAEVFHGDARELSDRAVGAVTPQHERAGERARRVVGDEPAADSHRRTTRRGARVFQFQHFESAMHANEWVLRDAIEEQRLELRLVEHVGLWKAVYPR